jgi:hypothetical protein
MIHEFTGHAFAGLADEYDADCSWSVEDLSYYQSTGRCLNVSATNDLTKVPWKDFIGRDGYNQEVGAYEGAWLCDKGFWRPEYTSTMRENPNMYYNAPSRWLIYKKLHEEAALPFSFGTFLQYDRKFITIKDEMWNIGRTDTLNVFASLNTTSGKMTVEAFGGGGTEELSFRATAAQKINFTDNGGGSVTLKTTGNDPYIYINNLQSNIPSDATSIKLTFEYKSNQAVNDAELFFFRGGAHVGSIPGLSLSEASDWTYMEFDLTSKIRELYPNFGYAGDFFRYDPTMNSTTYQISIRNLKLEVVATKEMADFSYNTQPWADFRGAIKEVTIKSGVASIGQSAFACSGITKIDIPATVTTISANAFRKCNSLNTIEVHYTDLAGITVDEDAFACIPDLTAINLIVPAGKEDIYRNTAPWKYMMGNGTAPAGSDCDECAMTAIAKIPVESFTLSPNPTDGIVNIDNPTGKEVAVYTISGTLLFKTHASVIDLRKYAPGMYLVKMGAKTGKLIKQ